MSTQLLWIIFSIIFYFLCLLHVYLSGTMVPKPENHARAKKISGVNLGIHEFIEDFKAYIEGVNRQNRLVNIAQAIGYGVAFFTSIHSYRLSL